MAVRYFFHTENGEPVLDGEGLELSGDAVARREGVAFFAEMLRDRADEFWTTGRFRLTIVDDEGRVVGQMTADDQGTPFFLDGTFH